MKTKISLALMALTLTAFLFGSGCRKGGDPGVGAGGATTQETDAQKGNTSGSGSAPNTTGENTGAAGGGTAGATTNEKETEPKK